MSYSHFPPINLFKKVLQGCPQTALIYVSLWELNRKKQRITIKRDDVKNRFLISPTLFRNHLLSLSRLEILSFEETPDYFLVDFIDESDD